LGHDGGRVTILVLPLAALSVLAVPATLGFSFFDDRCGAMMKQELARATSSWFIRVVRVKVGLGRSGPKSEEEVARHITS
jgi:hypothetical protein